MHHHWRPWFIPSWHLQLPSFWLPNFLANLVNWHSPCDVSVVFPSNSTWWKHCWHPCWVSPLCHGILSHHTHCAVYCAGTRQLWSSLLSVVTLMLFPGLDSIAQIGGLVIVSCSVLSMVVSSLFMYSTLLTQMATQPAIVKLCIIHTHCHVCWLIVLVVPADCCFTGKLRINCFQPIPCCTDQSIWHIILGVTSVQAQISGLLVPLSSVAHPWQWN